MKTYRAKSFIGYLTTNYRLRSIGLALFALSMTLSNVRAQSVGSGLQIFVRGDGTAPDWREMTLTVTRLQIGGAEAITGKRFFVTAFEGSRQLLIPRANAGSARFLAGGASRAGSVDQIYVTIGASSLTTEPPNAGTSPRVVPMVVKDNAIVLISSQSLMVKAGETRALVVSIVLGTNAVLTKAGVLALRPKFDADLFTSAPENFLNGAEILKVGLTEPFPELGIQVVRAKALDPATGVLRDLTLRTDTGASVSFSDVRSQNEALWRSRHGALNSKLVQRLGSLASTDVVQADVRMHVPGPQTLLTDADAPGTWEEAHAEFMAERSAAAASIVAAVSA